MSGIVADESLHSTSPLTLALSREGRGDRLALRAGHTLDSRFRENDDG